MKSGSTRHAAGICCIVLGSSLALIPAAAAQPGSNAQLQSEVQKALNNGKLKSVNAAVQGNNVVLTGTVPDYAAKELADRRVHRVNGVKGVDNEIQVAGPTVEDNTLRAQLSKKLVGYTIGYGTTAFDALTIEVHNGVVTLGGSVYWEPDKDSAAGIAANTPGVKDVIDNIQVQPTSPMDDQLRRELARVIYGSPQLQRYAMNPEKPIRIIVANGKVILAGVVDTEADKNIAGLKANQVPGVFQVTNEIQVAGQSK